MTLWSNKVRCGVGRRVSGSDSKVLYQQKVLPHPPVPSLSALSLEKCSFSGISGRLEPGESRIERLQIGTQPPTKWKKV